MPAPEPPVTTVPRYTMFTRSAKGTPALASASVLFSTGRLSPVSPDSLSARCCAEMMRASAGTMVPRCKSRRSPGTTSGPAIDIARPLRLTSASSAPDLLADRIVASVCVSVMKPITPLRPRTAAMAAASRNPPVAIDRTAAPASRAAAERPRLH